jgi:DUF1680 family protein
MNHALRQMSVGWTKLLLVWSLFSVPLLGGGADAGGQPDRPRPAGPVPFRVPAKWPDAIELLSPESVRVEGWLGQRLWANATNRLLRVDTEPLLAGYRKRPGNHPWIGEHVGKWLHAATLAWAYTGDSELRAKLDRVVTELIACQEPDGYLGTYVPEKRFGLYPGADWDVWSHKYNLIGLLTYYQYTGQPEALAACRRMADLLVRTFGPGNKSILSAGTHVGMAATSVLEPMVLLYRYTGEERYLEFAHYLVQAWDEPSGPKILHALRAGKPVHQVANGKAYEMLSNLVGLGELARATGDRTLLAPLVHAWQDIVSKRLYLTGSASQGEHFHDDYYLPNHEGAHVAETCVTTTWIQFNLQLLRLTGEARFANELERTFYNHLAAAQRPDGAQWCYFTPLEGRKAYGPGINCCVSSGPRGLALAPQAAYLKRRLADADALLVSTFETSTVRTELDGVPVTVHQNSQFPRKGQAVLRVKPARPARFALQVRAADWAQPVRLAVNGQAAETHLQDGWVTLSARQWADGDEVALQFSLGAGVVLGTHGNSGRAALVWGPFVLAYDTARNPGLPPPRRIGFVEFGKPPFTLRPGSDLLFGADIRTAQRPQPQRAIFVTFADAGRDGGLYQVWIRAPGAAWPTDESVLADGQESRSRPGNVAGSIIDGDPASLVVTFNGQPAAEDWFAVTLSQPVTIQRVAFVHGRTFHDGGWFDTAAGKPRIQVQRRPGGPWETVAELADYPATTATDPAGLKPGQRFVQRLPEPVTVVGVRVIGRPASGDNPRQAFSSCAELEAFGD